MYKLCGDTLDYIRHFIPSHITDRYGRNESLNKVLSCIKEFSRKELKPLNCRFPCEDLDLNIVSSSHEGTHSNNTAKESDITRYELSIQFQRVDTFKIMGRKRTVYVGSNGM